MTEFYCLVCHPAIKEKGKAHKPTEDQRHCNIWHWPSNSASCHVVHKGPKEGERSYYCLVHQQWVSEHCTSITYHFDTDEQEGTGG